MAHSFLDELPSGTADALLAGARRLVLEKGSWLFHEGDEAYEAFLLTDGLMKLLKVAPDGTQTLIGVRGPGALLGEISLIDGLERSTGALAAVSSTFLVVKRDRLAEVMDEDPTLSHTILSMLCRRLRASDDHILELARGDVSGLVAQGLLELATAPAFGAARDVGESIVIRLPLSQHELAAWAGVSPRSAAGALQRLRDEGVIDTGRMQIVVHDVDRLRIAAATSAAS